MTGSGGIGNGVIWSGHCGQFSNTMKPRVKRILAALFWLAIISIVIVNGLREQSLWIGGAL